MISVEDWFNALMNLLRESYRNAIYKTYSDSWPLLEWEEFRKIFMVSLDWVDVASASSLRRKATGSVLQNVIFPEATVENAFLLLEYVKDSNPWLKNHFHKMTPIVAEQTKAILAAEREFIYRRGRIEIQSDNPLYRLEMSWRNSVNAIVNTAQQIELSVPEIAVEFPFIEYLTRDDARVRPTHRVMYGFIAQREWIGWSRIIPPNGYNCRCYVIYRTRTESKERGWMGLNYTPKFMFRFPNSASRHNYLSNIFPDKGWRGPKIVSDDINIIKAA